MVFARMFPLPATEQDAELLKELVQLILMWMAIADVAPYPIEVPKFLRCCCCRNTKRTSCGFFYKLLFGHIKQLGIVLKNHH